MATNLLLVTDQIKRMVRDWQDAMEGKTRADLYTLERRITIHLEIELVRQQVLESRREVKDGN